MKLIRITLVTLLLTGTGYGALVSRNYGRSLFRDSVDSVYFKVGWQLKLDADQKADYQTIRQEGEVAFLKSAKNQETWISREFSPQSVRSIQERMKAFKVAQNPKFPLKIRQPGRPTIFSFWEKKSLYFFSTAGGFLLATADQDWNERNVQQFSKRLSLQSGAAK